MGPIETLRKAWQLGAPEAKELSVGQPLGGVGRNPWWISNAGWMRQLRDAGDGGSSSIVAACLRVLTDAITEAPVAVWQEGDDGTPVTVPDHPAIELLDRPNPFMIGDLLWEHYVWSTRIDGNAYYFKERSASGRVVELWPLASHLVEPKRRRDSNSLIDYYEYRPSGTAVELDPTDILHLRTGLDPHNHMKGTTRLKTVLREVLSDEEASRFAAALLSNMAIPGVILAPAPGELSPSPGDADAIKDKWRTNFGADRRGEPLVLTGPLQPTVVSFSPKDLDLTALRRLPEERITAALGVPAILAGLGAGLTSSSGRNESQTLIELFTERTIAPEWRRLGRWLTVELLPEFEPLSTRWIDFDLTDVRALQEDRDSVWQRVDSAIRSGWLTVAEGKRLVGLDPAEGDDVYLRSMSVEAVDPTAQLPEPVPNDVSELVG